MSVIPDDPGEQEGVGPVVVSGVVVAPELRPREREVPELVDEAPHPLLLRLQPLLIAKVPGLWRRESGGS